MLATTSEQEISMTQGIKDARKNLLPQSDDAHYMHGYEFSLKRQCDSLGMTSIFSEKIEELLR